jgi:hypothetical protein
MASAYLSSTDNPVRRGFALHLSPDVAAVILFSLVGLTVSAAVMTCMDADSFAWLLGAF